MKYVLDASVALKWELPEADSDKAIVLGNDFAHGTYQLVAPDVYPAEFSHALVRAQRRNILTEEEASRALLRMLKLLPLLFPIVPLLPRV
jgi:predicted nucleic acid-binding protein